MAKKAILAPIPKIHLESASEVSIRTGFVAFGSRKYHMFEKLNSDCPKTPLPVLIYASHSKNGEQMLDLNASWMGWYIGFIAAVNGKHPIGQECHRPDSTKSDSSDWYIFWHVAFLKKLNSQEHIPIHELKALSGTLRKKSAPRGPELIASPFNDHSPV